MIARQNCHYRVKDKLQKGKYSYLMDGGVVVCVKGLGCLTLT